MPQYMPIQLPPGLHQHGVELDSANRWRDGDLIRWQHGSVRPVGGWGPLQRDNAGVTEDVVVPLSGVARGALTWLDNGNAPYLAFATDDYLYCCDVSLVPTDITPVGFVAGTAGENLGYGGKKYGKSTYGTARISDGVTAPASVWSLDTWGEQLLAMTSGDRKIYYWDLAAGTASQVPNSPLCNYMLVTPERFIFALGAGTNPRKVQWCDREDYSTWTPSSVNEAGDIELVTAGGLMGGVRVRGRTLLLTQYEAFIATYQGPPTVYGFQKVGSGCGLIAPKMVAAAGPGAIWMGSNGFYMYDGSQATEIPCEVLDGVFTNINREEIRKGWAVTNEKFGEVWWFYPSSGSLEPDKYVMFSYEESYWTIGNLSRTAGVDRGAFPNPIWIANDVVYQHEYGWSHADTDPYIESGPLQLGNGDEMIHATQMIHDELKTLDEAVITMDVTTQFTPDGTEYDWGPYTLENYTDVRFTGRQARLRLTAADGKTWRVGGIRVEYESGGRR